VPLVYPFYSTLNSFLSKMYSTVSWRREYMVYMHTVSFCSLHYYFCFECIRTASDQRIYSSFGAV